MDQTADLFLITLLGCLLMVAALTDLRFQRIPNHLTYPGMIVALTYHAATKGLEGLLVSAGGLALGIGILILPHLMGGMGAGDAKLMGAIGAILGPKGVFLAFLFTAILGGIYSLTLLLATGKYVTEFVKRWGTMLKILVCSTQLIYIPPVKRQRRPKLRYGVVIALGTMCSVVWRLAGKTFPI